jgi:lipopolysaccharide transport system ATP-binding protein
MSVRLAFAVAAHLEPEILVVDEVLAVGDIEFQKKCIGKMEDVAGGGRTVLFVSHNMGAVQRLCARSILLRSGSVDYIGDTGVCVERYINGVRAGLTQEGEYPNYILSADVPDGEFGIYGMQILSLDRMTNSICRTWDDFVFRIHYSCPWTIDDAEVVVSIETLDGVLLMSCGIAKRWNRRVALLKGQHYLELVVRHFPLASGEYVLTVGFAIRQTRWLCCQRTRLNVRQKDVYSTGYPPVAKDTFIVPDYNWELGCAADTTTRMNGCESTG